MRSAVSRIPVRFTGSSVVFRDVITLKSSCKSRAKEMLTLSRGLTAASPLLCPLSAHTPSAKGKAFTSHSRSHDVAQVSRIVGLNCLQVIGPAGSSHFSPRLWVEDFFPFPLAWRPSLRFFPSSLIRHWAFSPSSSPSPLPHSPCRHRKTSPKPVPYTHRQTFLIWARVSSFCESLFLGARRWCNQDWYCQEQRGREVYRK